MSGSSESIPENFGSYLIEAIIGRGGMGVVYRAVDTRLDRKVALKVLPDTFARDQVRLSRFETEAKTVASLDHPSIVTIFAIDEIDGKHFIVMELISGSTLAKEIAQGAMDLMRILDIITPIVEAMSVAHQKGIIHRDLKPENVMICDDGQIKVLDFGLAKATGPQSMNDLSDEDMTLEYSAGVTQQGQIVGTPAYMSPEQAEGKPIDVRTDIFSFGVILYELATARKPFRGDTAISTITSVLREDPVPLTEVKPNLPRYLGRIISRCLEKNPDRRYQTALDLRNDLDQLRKEMSTGELAKPDFLDQVDPKSTKRSKSAPILWLIPLILVIFGLTKFYFDSNSEGNFLSSPPSVNSAFDGQAVAVVGFQNLSDPEDQGNLGAILVSLVASELASSESLKIVSQQRVSFAKQVILGKSNTSFDVTKADKIAAKAGAGVMICGSISQLGSKFIVSTEVSRVSDGTQLVSGNVEVNDESELFSVAGEISTLVMEGLGKKNSKDNYEARTRLTEVPEALKWYIAGTTASHTLNFVKAIQAYRRALEIDPSFARASMDLAMAIRKNGGKKEAIHVLEKGFSHIQRLSEEEQMIFRAQHDHLVNVRYPDLAVQLLEELVSRDCTNPSAYYLLGECYTHAAVVKDLDRAHTLFLRAVELAPTYRISLYHVVEGFIGKDRLAEGHAYLDNLEQDAPGDPSIINARLYLLLAEERFAEILDLNERYPNSEIVPSEFVADCYCRSGDFDLMLKFEEEEKRDQTGFRLTGTYLSRHTRRITKGQFREASEIYENSWGMHEGQRGVTGVGDIMHPVLIRHEGISKFISGDIEGGLEILQLLKSRKDTQGMQQFWLGYYLAESGKTNQAKEILRVLEASIQGLSAPFVSSRINLLGMKIALEEGRNEEAMSFLQSNQRISILNRELGIEGLMASDLYQKLGNKEEALNRLKWISKPQGRFDISDAIVIEAIYQLAVSQDGIGQVSESRKLYEEFLEFWGVADTHMPQVTQARKRLVELDSQ